MADKTILVAGAGIGGLTTALFLHQAGYDVKVFESVSEIKAPGLGINILPHAVARLYKLGLQDALVATGIQTEKLAFFTRHGARIWEEPRGMAAGYPVPQFSIHRGQLQMILLEAVVARIGAENVLTNHHLADFEQDETGVTARFVDRKTGDTVGSYRGTALIGADGVMSRVREIFYPDEGVPAYSGIFLWRGIMEGEPFLGGKTMVMIGHNTVKAVIYPVSKEADERGRSLLNWVADLPIPMDLPPEKEEWNRRAQSMDFVQHYVKWQFPWLNVYNLFSNTDTVYEFPMIDRDPVARWTFGRITLLGDAAHAMRPNGSNGASQAIIDAETLTQQLQTQETLPQALSAYEAIRLEPMRKLVLENRKAGPERVMQMAEDNCDGSCKEVCTHVPAEVLEAVASRYKRIAGFDKEAVRKAAGME